jgi:NADPH:quinone reductase-like Zn-dependent oxidoreductase
VGGFATQLAVRAGLHVIAVAGRDDEPWVAALGAAEVLPRDADLGALAPVDGVLDGAALGPARATLPLRDGGTAVFVRASQPSTSDRHRFEHVTVQAAPATLREMARLLGQGALRTRVARVLPLDQAAEGHRLTQAGGLHGKVVLTSPG